MATATSKARAKTATPQVSVTIAKFDTQDPYRTIREGVPIVEWQPIIRADYNPRGGTPLRDATAKFIAHLADQAGRGKVVIGCLADESGSMGGNEESVVAGINEFVAGMADVEVDPDTDGKVLAVILTDGMENSSREVSADDLRAMVDQREKEGWTFIYLGANQDAWAVGNTAGMRGNSSSLYNYTASPAGTAQAMSAATTDASAWLGETSQREQTKESMGGTTMGNISESGELSGAQGIDPKWQAEMDKRQKAKEKRDKEAPTEGSAFDIASAIQKAKGEKSEEEVGS